MGGGLDFELILFSLTRRNFSFLSIMEVNSSASGHSQIGFPTLKIHPVTLQVVFPLLPTMFWHRDENLSASTLNIQVGISDFCCCCYCFFVFFGMVSSRI